MQAVGRLFLEIVCLYQHSHLEKDSWLQVEIRHIQRGVADHSTVHECHRKSEIYLEVSILILTLCKSDLKSVGGGELP